MAGVIRKLETLKGNHRWVQDQHDLLFEDVKCFGHCVEEEYMGKNNAIQISQKQKAILQADYY